METLEERLQSIFKEDYDAFQASLQEEPKKGFYTNNRRKDVISKLDATKFSRHPYIQDGYYYDADLELGKHPYFLTGCYYIQEPSAMAVAALLDIQKDDYILDMCAAPGGKTCYAASRISNQGLCIANDINTLRAKVLSENIERFGLSNTIVTNIDPLRFTKHFENFFDKIILDAPCSGEGMIRKDIKAVTTWSMQKVNECAYIQKNLLEAALKLVKPGGKVIYSTCTYEYEENEQQVQYALDNYPCKLIPIELQKGMCEGSIAGTIRMYPHINQGEGQFIAILEKTGSGDVTKASILKSNIKKEEYKYIKEFFDNNLNIPVPNYLYNSKGHIYAISPHFPMMEGVKIVKNGLHLGVLKKNRFEPDHALALTLSKEDVKRYYDFTSDDPRIKDYIHGLSLTGDGEKGYGVIFVDGYPLSFYKESGGQVKNLYPKGLRR